MIAAIQSNAEQKMKKSVEALKTELAKLRTGRAHPSLLEHLRVDYYGSAVPISQVGNISVEGGRTLQIAVWEKGMVQDIERAILKSDLGLNPATAGLIIRIPMPPLTEERRKELVKALYATGEMTRVSVRAARKDAKKELSRLLKDKEISEDDERRAEGLLQQATDKAIADVEAVLKSKENDLMEI